MRKNLENSAPLFPLVMDQHFASLKRTKFAEGQSWETQTVLSEFCTNLITKWKVEHVCVFKNL